MQLVASATTILQNGLPSPCNDIPNKTHHHLRKQPHACNSCASNVRYLVPERLRPWRREGPLEPLHDALLRLRHTWRATNVRNAKCSTKWRTKRDNEEGPKSENGGSSGGGQTVAAANGGVGLGDWPRHLQQRAAGVEQQPPVRRRPPAAPSARCNQTTRHSRSGQSATEGRERGRRSSPEEGAARRGGGRHLQRGVRRRVRERYEAKRHGECAARISKHGQGAEGQGHFGQIEERGREEREKSKDPNPKPPRPPPLAAAAS